MRGTHRGLWRARASRARSNLHSLGYRARNEEVHRTEVWRMSP